MKKNITIFGSARFEDDNIYCKKAYELGKILAKNGYSIVTGGGPGIMMAANKGAYEIGGVESIGINIKLPFEQVPNKFCTKTYIYDDLSLRKKALMESEIIVIFPGGYGTLDEFFEVLTLTQTNLKKYKIILFDEKFYSSLVDFFKNVLLEHKAISSDSLDIFKIANTIDEILEFIKE
ncbi:TIGR00730 family Rossman fold protein [Campylobacter sp. MG1]|uniref:LOG family protein n=1 Tax=Campylobacter sp. MG1 TaxID=2976332 RepID=UPI00226C7E88|nr:TIGR00730 family Rossman fold protein [Campylobacter sp. MG1]